MNDVVPDPVDVAAPVQALAWSPSRGFIVDLDDLTEARLEGEHVLEVTDATDGAPFGVVADVEGEAPLAVDVRQDRELAEVRTVLARVVDRLAGVDVAELEARVTGLVRSVAALEDRAEGADTGNAIEISALKTRVRRLEERP
jgi:hypothetical protein